MPLAAESVVAKLIQEWKQHAIEGWTSCGWVDQAESLSQLAPLMGARPDEIAVTGSTTVNLHQLLATFYHPRSDKRKILIDSHAFPSDRYAAISHLRLRGCDPGTDLVVVSPRNDHNTVKVGSEVNNSKRKGLEIDALESKTLHGRSVLGRGDGAT
jgi:kynureninase